VTDQISKNPVRHRSNEKAEYRVFFLIIFLMALPIAVCTWCRDLVRGNSEVLSHGVLCRALAAGRATTPMILSA